jgi:hypothetical protein
MYNPVAMVAFGPYALREELAAHECIPGQKKHSNVDGNVDGYPGEIFFEMGPGRIRDSTTDKEPTPRAIGYDR